MQSLLQKTLDDLELRRIGYCLLRHDDLSASHVEHAYPTAQHSDEDSPTQRCIEIDVLVSEQDSIFFERVLVHRGFVRLRRWGYAPHRFFIGYDEDSDRWIKLDVVTRIAFGSPQHAYHTDLGTDCLAYRRYSGGVPVPAPEEELIALLLHCIIDKQAFATHRSRQLQNLCREVSAEERILQLVAKYWPATVPWHQIQQWINEGEWDRLLATRSDLLRTLRRRSPVRCTARRWRDWFLRKAGKAVRLLRPEIPTVALLAPDGAGKSTVASGVAETFFFPAEHVYMGLYQNDDARPWFSQIPGMGLFLRITRQWGRYLKACFHRAAGRLVLFDRYQYDALLPSNKSLSLTSRLRRWLLAHTCPHADLVFVLDAPGSVLFHRKGEHSAEILEAQRQAYRSLATQLPHVVIIDAAQDADAVRRQVISCIWKRFSRHTEEEVSQ